LRPHREQATGRAFHRDPAAGPPAGAQIEYERRMSSPPDRRSQRQVLAGLEEELLAQLFRNVERDSRSPSRVSRSTLDTASEM
jgi:hypothetical protein